MTSKYKTMTTFVTRSSYSTLEQILGSIKDLPPSERPDALRAAEQPVKSLLNEMKEKNQISKWNSLGKIKSENVFPRAFTEVGLNDVDAKIGTPNNDADFNFIVTVTLTTSLDKPGRSAVMRNSRFFSSTSHGNASFAGKEPTESG